MCLEIKARIDELEYQITGLYPFWDSDTRDAKVYGKVIKNLMARKIYWTNKLNEDLEKQAQEQPQNNGESDSE